MSVSRQPDGGGGVTCDAGGGGVSGRTQVLGGDGLEADDLQCSGSEDQLAAPRVEVLHKYKETQQGGQWAWPMMSHD